MAGFEAAVARHDVEQVRLREATHLHDGVDEISGPVEGQCPARVVRDPPGSEIERGSRAPVERDLRLTSREPALGRGEIEIGEADRALEFEHAVPSQEELGDVRGRGVHLSRARQAACQELDDCVLIHG
ncbi:MULTISPECIES: hypothetical protein [Methylobacterium]|uniref:Uncharacterized protein n=1 Tax=Methylobacterium radiotolerans TaxID=31998 RepID=A0ABV2NBX2_9HYPH|nr:MULTISPECIES: hypothetical protein [unclassified Methylobacterium]MBP2492774.1 hypothetical protein [Methylobacterium sp. PvP105]MBP2500854.1 hypothetical protein [Methylobacterium sp. PvP109]MCX7336389.1 hypothetical protein [Hyphomicrobiales bacterium]